MPINIPNATATCTDCGKQITGPLTIDVFDYAHVTNNSGTAENDLVIDCGDHHDMFRTGDKEAPQHCDFVVTEGQKLVGQIWNVSSFGSIARIDIQDPEYARQFAELIRQMQRDRGYTARYRI